MPLYTESLCLDSLTADPSTPVEGQHWYNVTSLQHKKVRNSTVETDVAIVGSPTNGQVPTWNASTSQWNPATPISSLEATASASTTTSSTTDVRLNSMVLTPGAGTYLALFGSSLSQSNSSSVYVSFYVNSALLASSQRQFTVTDGKVVNSVFPICIQAVLTNVTDGQVVEVKWRATAATATAYNRTLTLVKIG